MELNRRVILTLAGACTAATVGAGFFISTRPLALSQFKTALATKDHADLLVIGDSTGVTKDRLIYRFGVYVAASYPDRKTRFHWYDRDLDDFGSVTELGAGLKTIDIYNASRTGFRFLDWIGPRFVKISSIEPDLVIINVGLNSAYMKDQGKALSEFMSGLSTVRTRWPHVPILMNLQQPMRDDDSMALIVAAQQEAARQFDEITLIDSYTPILKAGKPKAWYADDTHLNALGDSKQLIVWLRHWDHA